MRPSFIFFSPINPPTNHKDFKVQISSKISKMTYLFLSLSILLLMFATPIKAKQWQNDYEKSSLHFTGWLGGKAFEGTFKNFQIDTNFDPENLSTSSIKCTINMQSAKTGDGDKDTQLPMKEWFDSKIFSKAIFESASIKKEGNAYIADGNLTIKGISVPTQLKFNLFKQGSVTRITGGTSLLRNQFSVGTGDWNNENYVKFNVDIKFDVTTVEQG